jgi:hypothetical protein
VPRKPFSSFSSTFLVFAFASLGLACTHVRVSDVTGPDGREWKLLSCSHMNKKCFAAAHEMCPNGYYFARAKRVPDGSKATSAKGAPENASPKVTRLPPQEDWDGDMYSRQSGQLLVKCAERPELEASR